MFFAVLTILPDTAKSILIASTHLLLVMNISAKTIHEFALELKKVVDDFEEEMEILSNKELMNQIKSSEEDRVKGNTITFTTTQELKKALGLE
jgi:hypothetical protein